MVFWAMVPVNHGDAYDALTANPEEMTETRNARRQPAISRTLAVSDDSKARRSSDHDPCSPIEMASAW
jgi:hypothetical protein